jgi:hypothetical protein
MGRLAIEEIDQLGYGRRCEGPPRFQRLSESSSQLEAIRSVKEVTHGGKKSVGPSTQPPEHLVQSRGIGHVRGFSVVAGRREKSRSVARESFEQAGEGAFVTCPGQAPHGEVADPAVYALRQLVKELVVEFAPRICRLVGVREGT